MNSAAFINMWICSVNKKITENIDYVALVHRQSSLSGQRTSS